MREDVLREMASRAVRDPDFLRRARQNLESTLVRYGYRLSGEELRLVKGLRRRTAGMSDAALARALSDGLAGRTPAPPARPAAPGWRSSGPSSPARPGD